MGDRFSRIGPVQIFQGRVLAAIGRDHAIHRLRGDQTTLAGIDEDEVVRRLSNVRGNASAGDARRHAVIRRIFLIGILVELLHRLPILGLVDRPVGADSPQQ